MGFKSQNTECMQCQNHSSFKQVVCKKKIGFHTWENLTHSLYVLDAGLGAPTPGSSSPYGAVMMECPTPMHH